MINTTYCQLMVTNVVKSSPSTEPSWWPPGDCSGSSPRYLSIEALPAVFEVPGHLGALGGDVWNPQKRCRKGMMCLKSLHLYCYSEYSWVYFWSDFTFYVFFICFGGCCCSHGYNRGEWLPQTAEWPDMVPVVWCLISGMVPVDSMNRFWDELKTPTRSNHDPTSCLV